MTRRLLDRTKQGVLIGPREQRCFMGNHLDATVASESTARPVIPEVVSQNTLGYPNT